MATKKGKMTKRIVSRIILLLLLVGILSLTLHIQQSEAEHRTWTVDDDGPADFHTIQEAVNTANEGDTISVHSGIYHENVVMNKAVSLLGENSNTTVINVHSVWSNAITIEANWVNITGFSITGGDSAIYFPKHCSNTSIIDCSIYNNDKGMYSGEVISDTSVINCNIFNNRYGVILFGSSHVIEGCRIFSNEEGIGLHTPSDNCTIANCSVWNNDWAVFVAVSSGHVIRNSHIFNNTSGVLFVGNGIDPVTGHTVINCYISNNTQGIYLSSTLNSHINITDCTIIDNELGVCVLSRSYDNAIHHNNFIGNTHQARDESSNSWNKEYPFGGNYWSDYDGVDLYSGPYQTETGSDGIGDTPYSVDVKKEDKYPLMSRRPILSVQRINTEFYGLFADYKETESKYDNLKLDYSNLDATYIGLIENYTSLQTKLDDLHSQARTLTNELNITRNIVYIFLTTTIVFIVTSVYLETKRSKIETELGTT
jgi:parallel beta-helix repeat protein